MNDEKQRKIIADNLQVLDIDPDATLVYLELAKLGPGSALQLAKLTKISRTQIYRRLESLQQHGLVSAEQLSYGTLFRALPIENIEGLIADREAQTSALKHNVSLMMETVQHITGSAGPRATVQHYYGTAGLKQVNWNLTKANGEYKVFELAHLPEHFDKAFARRCRARYIERELTSYDLTNDTFVTAAQMEPFNPERTFLRHIDPAVIAITIETYIYNDVVTILDYHEDQQMAIEIHHPILNTMMTQLFDTIWAQATPLKIQ
jgi:sugar-specific transcriptional regulator TrmB